MEPSNIRIEATTIHDLEGDALILPSVADRLQESEFHRDIYDSAGNNVVNSFTTDLPLKIGNVSVTEGGNLPVNTIVHVPVQTAPGVPTTEENLQIGLRSGLVTADEEGTTTVLLAKIVPPDQDLDLTSVSETFHQDLIQYPPAHFDTIKLFANDPDWTQALKQEFNN